MPRTFQKGSPQSGSVQPKSVAIILLAAGNSSRMRISKQFLLYQGTSLLQQAAERAVKSKVKYVCVVLGFEAERMKEELRDLNVEIIYNPSWKEGMSSSIRAGINALPQTIDAALIMLCDQPLVTVDLLQSTVTTYASSDKKIVACEYSATVGVPALFDRSLFSELLGLQGDRGAKEVIIKHLDQVARIPFPDASVDIDTLEDYERIK